MAVKMTTERALAGSARRAEPKRLKASFDALTTNRTSGFLLVLALLGLWELSARMHWVSGQSWPPFSSVLTATWDGLRSGELSGILGSTLARMFAGYFIGCVCGIAVGLLLGTVRTLDRLVTPLTEALRPLPIPAIVPPLILFLGLDDALKVFVVAF